MAGAEIRADPVALVRLADQVLRASQQIADAWRGAQAELTVEDIGDNHSAAAVRDAHASTVDAADLAFGRLAGVLEIDSDLLYQVAVAYHKADDMAAAKLALIPV
jgi:hypothetical protein